MEHNAQEIAKPLGKILRLDPDLRAASPLHRAADNPFARGPGPHWSGATACATPSASPSTAYRRLVPLLRIGDVGQSAREEVDRASGAEHGRGRQLRLELPARATLRAPKRGDDPGVHRTRRHLHRS